MANYRRILVGRRSARRWALVDVEQYDRLNALRWSCGDGDAAVSSVDGRTVSMHRLVLDAEPGDRRTIEHINGNKLDNRRANLRFYEKKHEPPPPVEEAPRPDGAVIRVGGNRPRRAGRPSPVLWARVDDEDVDRLAAYRWSPRARNAGADAVTRVPRSSGGYATIPMHRLIMGLAPGDPRVVDHINGDELDNRKSNLRVCTVAENGQNRRRRSGKSSRFRGVVHAPGNGHRWPWVIQLRFPTEAEAAEWVARYRREYMPFAGD